MLLSLLLLTSTSIFFFYISGFITFENSQDAQKAIKELKNTPLGFRSEISHYNNENNAKKDREDGEVRDHHRRRSRTRGNRSGSHDLRDELQRGRSSRSPRRRHRRGHSSRDGSRHRHHRRDDSRHHRRRGYSSNGSSSRSQSRSVTPPRTNRYISYWGNRRKRRSPSYSGDRSGESLKRRSSSRRNGDGHRQRRSSRRSPSPNARSPSYERIVIARSPKARSPLPADSR